MAGRVFILSPANCAGKRGQMLLRPDVSGDLAVRLRHGDDVPLGELFAFISGLYFRGKLAYATRFAAPPSTSDAPVGGVHVITSTQGLCNPDVRVGAETVRRFAQASIDLTNDAYRRPLEQSAAALRRVVGDCEVVLLGSIASPKYVDVLLAIFGDKLLFPSSFVGRGDMSRGGLLLRQVAAGEELAYVPVGGSERRGVRPPKLDPMESPRVVQRRMPRAADADTNAGPRVTNRGRERS